MNALIVRAAGLSTHLLDADGRARVLGAADFSTLTRELAAAGYLSAESRPDAAALETAIRRGASARLRQLARWDQGQRLAPILFGDEDRRTLRALLRGAVAALPAEARLLGAIPTPTLPERVQAELARQQSVAAIVILLTLWRSPYAEPLQPGRTGEPDLLSLEVALGRAVLEDSLRAAGRDRGWRDFLSESVDLDNLRTGLVLAGRGDELAPERLFLPGGAHLTQETFTGIARSASPEEGLSIAARAWAGDPLAGVFRRGGAALLSLESAIDTVRRRAWGRRARFEPLGAAPVVHYLLCLRREVVVLQRAVWSLSLGVPALERQRTEARS